MRYSRPMSWAVLTRLPNGGRRKTHSWSPSAEQVRQVRVTVRELLDGERSPAAGRWTAR